MGRKHTLETRKKISKALTGRKLSLEHCQKLSDAHRGEKNPFWGRKHSLETRRKIGDALRGEKRPRGEKSSSWKGGRTYTRGYVKISRAGHPFADCNGYVMEHRLVVERALGRYLKPNELVHHINQIRDDNRLENLRLVNHHREAICPRCGWPMGNMQEYAGLCEEKE